MSGVPPHTLTLQEGCPVIFLRNMPSGLANGTRFIVVKLMQHIIDAEIALMEQALIVIHKITTNLITINGH
jgi:hypothetical protein